MVQIRHTDDTRWVELMHLALRGNHTAYEDLLGQLGHAIEGFLRNRLGPVDYIEDIVQESLLAIHQARHTWQPERPLRPWVFAIVRHKAIDALRRRKTRENSVAVTFDDPDTNTCPVHCSAELLLEGAELFRGISPTFHQALWLTRIAGLSIREAAARTGVSEVAMKVRVHRALKALTRKLEDEQNDQ